MNKTALEVAQSMHLPGYVQEVIGGYPYHPQTRTAAFHRFYDAPIFNGQVDETFSHMDNQRVAFRMAFILSEAIEIMEKGLGLKVEMIVSGYNEDDGVQAFHAEGSKNGPLTDAILSAMQAGGKRDVVEVVDGLGDLNVVVNGWALELGARMNDVDREICASNFTKADADGKPMVSDGTDGHPKGKVLKGPNYVEPNIRAVLGLDKPTIDPAKFV